MKKIIFLLTVIGLFALNGFTQTPNFSGDWSLDKAKSKLEKFQADQIQSQTLKVEQSDKEIKITITTQQPVAQGGVDVGGGTNTYSLDGKENKTEKETPIGTMPMTLKGEIKNGELLLQVTRTLNTASGEVSITTKEIWTLSADGKTLTIKRNAETPQRTISSELTFTKKN